MSKRNNRVSPWMVKLTGFELKSLEKNSLAVVKVPHLDNFGLPTGRMVTVRVYPDNVDEYGRIYIYRRGKRIYPQRRRV